MNFSSIVLSLTIHRVASQCLIRECKLKFWFLVLVFRSGVVVIELVAIEHWAVVNFSA